MAITRHRPDWHSVFLVIIAGSMLATASVSDLATSGSGGLHVACGIPGGDAGAPREGVRVVDEEIGAKPLQIIELAAPHRYASLWFAGRFGQSLTLSPHNLSAGHATTKISHGEATTATQALSHGHVRVTRLRNGSVLCSRELPPAHIVALPCGVNDDTASGGDDSEDDDDSQDDQNGANDTQLPLLACFSSAFPYFIAPEGALTLSWDVPSFPPFRTLQRLRC